MRPGKGRYAWWAAWLGVAALVLNALVPIHVAFDIAEAVGAAEPHVGHTEAHGAAWMVLAALSGHTETDPQSGEHGRDQGHRHGRHGAACAVCGALGALAGFAPAAAVVLPLPPPAAAPPPPPDLASAPAGTFYAYRSRAPPAA